MAKQRAGRRPVVGLVGFTAAALLVAVGSASAQSTAPARSDTQAKKTTVQKQQQSRRATQAAPGLTIARDADTGVLRAPTDTEAAQLAAPAETSSTPIVEFVTEVGVIAAQVPEDLLTYTVVSKRADGTIDSICLPDKQSAETAVQILARTPRQAPSPVSINRTPLRPAAGAPNE